MQRSYSHNSLQFMQQQQMLLPQALPFAAHQSHHHTPPQVQLATPSVLARASSHADLAANPKGDQSKHNARGRNAGMVGPPVHIRSNSDTVEKLSWMSMKGSVKRASPGLEGEGLRQQPKGTVLPASVAPVPLTSSPHTLVPLEGGGHNPISSPPGMLPAHEPGGGGLPSVQIHPLTMGYAYDPSGVYGVPQPPNHGMSLGDDGRSMKNAYDILLLSLCHQIEYYFSAENLIRDVYLRSKMDMNGYVLLTEIAKFNRVRSMTTNHKTLWRAVSLSTVLDVCHEGDVCKIRTRQSPQRWLLTNAQEDRVKDNNVQLSPPANTTKAV